MACKYDENGKRITGVKGMKIETVVSQRVGRLMSEPKRIFNIKERTVIMNLCRMNKWDYEVTGKMVGIHPKTLKMWRTMELTEEIDAVAKAVIDQLVLRTADNHPKDGVAVIQNPIVSLEKAEMGMDRIIDDAVKARRLAIERLLQIIPEEKRVDNLLAVIKEMNILVQNDNDIIKGDSGDILSELNKLTTGANINQEEMLATIMSKLPKSNFVQINNYQKVEDVEVEAEIQEETKTE